MRVPFNERGVDEVLPHRRIGHAEVLTDFMVPKYNSTLNLGQQGQEPEKHLRVSQLNQGVVAGSGVHDEVYREP